VCEKEKKMIIFLLIAAGFACLPAYRSLKAVLALLPLIPDKNEDFDFSLVNSDAAPVQADGEPVSNAHHGSATAHANIAATAS
jgi:hypothetical protein